MSRQGKTLSSDKTILLFGKNGQLGACLYQLLQGRNLKAFDIPEVDFNQPDSIAQLIDNINPGLIINAAAYTAVDQAEKDRQLAFNINGHTVGKIAKKAQEHQAAFIHYSTDYVFDGLKGALYLEDDFPNPINVYGQSKLLGEQEINQAGGSYLIFRLSWVYSLDNPSFVTKVLEWARKNEKLRIVDDQTSNPTWAMMVARKTIQIVDKFSYNWFSEFQRHSGIYHLAGKGAVSRYDWAKAILEFDPKQQEQVTQKLLPAKTREFPSPAERPKFSGLNCSKFEQTFNLEIPDWRTSLIESMSEKQSSS